MPVKGSSTESAKNAGQSLADSGLRHFRFHHLANGSTKLAAKDFRR